MLKNTQVEGLYSLPLFSQTDSDTKCIVIETPYVKVGGNFWKPNRLTLEYRSNVNSIDSALGWLSSGKNPDLLK